MKKNCRKIEGLVVGIVKCFAYAWVLDNIEDLNLKVQKYYKVTVVMFNFIHFTIFILMLISYLLIEITFLNFNTPAQ